MKKKYLIEEYGLGPVPAQSIADLSSFDKKELKRKAGKGIKFKFTLLKDIIYNKKSFLVIYSTYNSVLNEANVNNFNSILSYMQKTGAVGNLSTILVNTVKVMGYDKYVRAIPDKYFSSVGMDKKLYIQIISNDYLTEKDKSYLYQKIKIIPEKGNDISKKIKGKIMFTGGLGMAGSGINYFISETVVPKISQASPALDVDTTLSLTISIIYSIVFGILIISTFFDKYYKVPLIKTFIKVPITSSIIRSMNTLKLYSLFLIGQTSSYDEVLDSYNSSFPYALEQSKKGNIDTLIENIFEDPERSKYFSHAIFSLRSLRGKGLEDIKKSIENSMSGTLASLEEDVGTFGKALSSIGFIALLGIVILPLASIATLMRGISDSVSELSNQL